MSGGAGVAGAFATAGASAAATSWGVARQVRSTKKQNLFFIEPSVPNGWLPSNSFLLWRHVGTAKFPQKINFRVYSSIKHGVASINTAKHTDFPCLFREFSHQDFGIFTYWKEESSDASGKGLGAVNVMATSTSGHLAGDQAAC